jgi:hypothetical protein
MQLFFKFSDVADFFLFVGLQKEERAVLRNSTDEKAKILTFSTGFK